MEMGFHIGEIKAQGLAGVRLPDDFAAKMYRNFIPEAARGFLQKQVFVFLATIDRTGSVWASVVHGEPGFIRLEEARKILITGTFNQGDPFVGNIQENGQIGTLFMDLLNRRRLRVNGKAAFDEGHLVIHPEQVYGNCPKYITTRRVKTDKNNEQLMKSVIKGTRLAVSQTKWIEGADTFFIASTNGSGEMDASHRGGSPGFIKVMDDKNIIFPDYFGNNMFNTLGNLESDPNAGLLFIDFIDCNTLQVTGKARVLWNEGAAKEFPGAERLIHFEIDRLIETRSPFRFSSELLERSPFHPV
ncbi:pyridoxamine 5'-phosphate oxidase family protein [Bacillus sp. REN3]|uniref:pyridoxamine 5'-phosphate oxidase family protein n=1 Tax=Bacillus sp. REN3 TaxID=2802440 RepID=UPI001AEE7F47|nr:pyridoxamine 5'-phosphate oxidase family protein [Bacillus sp. REN3]